MARGRKPRSWVKLDCHGILHGSINYLLTLEEQAVWIKSIAYSEVCGGPPGSIQDNEDNGLPRDYLAQELHCPIDVLNSMVDKMILDKAISTNGNGVIKLENFEAYQFSEYDRQKPFREKRKEKKPYGEFGNVLLLDEEKEKLVAKFGESGFKERVEKLSIGIESKGYKYRSHYATILNWERMDDKDRRPAGQKSSTNQVFRKYKQ